MTDARPACSIDEDGEQPGGDAPCWAHLFEDEDESASEHEQIAVTILYSSAGSVE